MNSRQRVLAALAREPVDRTPVCNPTSVATVELMDLVDAHFPEANRDAEKMARAKRSSASPTPPRAIIFRIGSDPDKERKR